MAETPLRWARIDEDLMTRARAAAHAAGEAADDSTLIRAGLYLLVEADVTGAGEAIERGRKVAGWPRRAAS